MRNMIVMLIAPLLLLFVLAIDLGMNVGALGIVVVAWALLIIGLMTRKWFKGL